MGTVSFNKALGFLRKGSVDGKPFRATRKGWHGKGMFIYIEPGKIITGLREPLKGWLDGQDEIEILPHINMYVYGKLVSGWLASQTDMLSDDWVVMD